jgi:hypothetical protein
MCQLPCCSAQLSSATVCRTGICRICSQPNTTACLPRSESMYCSGLAGLLLLQAGSQVATVLVNSLLTCDAVAQLSLRVVPAPLLQCSATLC